MRKHKLFSALILFIGAGPIQFIINFLKNSSRIIVFISGIISSIATFFVPDPLDFITNSFSFIQSIFANSYNSVAEFIANRLKGSTIETSENKISLKDLTDKIKFTSSEDKPEPRFNSLRKYYRNITINGQDLDESWLDSPYFFIFLFFLLSCGTVIITLSYYDTSGTFIENVYKYTGFAALVSFFKNLGWTGPGTPPVSDDTDIIFPDPQAPLSPSIPDDIELKDQRGDQPEGTQGGEPGPSNFGEKKSSFETFPEPKNTWKGHTAQKPSDYSDYFYAPDKTEGNNSNTVRPSSPNLEYDGLPLARKGKDREDSISRTR